MSTPVPSMASVKLKVEKALASKKIPTPVSSSEYKRTTKDTYRPTDTEDRRESLCQDSRDDVQCVGPAMLLPPPRPGQMASLYTGKKETASLSRPPQTDRKPRGKRAV